MRLVIKPVISVIAYLLALNSAFSQDGGGSKALVPFADSLRARGIEISEPSLVGALRNNDPEIRGLAALQLAQDHDFESVPAIEDALSIEDVPDTRISIAAALWSLHDPKGLIHLQAMCSEAPVSTTILMRLMQTIAGMGGSNASCANSVLDFLDSHTDSASRIVFCTTLPYLFRRVSSAQANHITRLLQDMLADHGPSVRMEASHALAEIGERSSAAAIRGALAVETDPAVRARMQTDLSIIEKPR